MTPDPVKPPPPVRPVEDRRADLAALESVIWTTGPDLKGAEVIGRLIGDAEASLGLVEANLDLAGRLSAVEAERDRLRSAVEAGNVNMRVAGEKLDGMRRERSEAQAALAAVQADVKRYAETLLSMRFSKYRDAEGWAWLNAEGIGSKLAALAVSPPEPEAETTHACPPTDEMLTPCCRRTPFELPRSDRMTSESSLVTCAGPTPAPVDQPEPPTEPGERATCEHCGKRTSNSHFCACPYDGDKCPGHPGPVPAAPEEGK